MAQYELYKLYNKAMYNTALRIVGNQEEAEDVLQEAFLAAFRMLSSYRGEASFGAWLKRIVVNKSINKVKKQNPMQSVTEDGEIGEYYEWPEEGNNEIDVSAIREGINQLPTGFRSVLSLYLLEGYDHTEIAEILGISVSTSKSQFNRAKKKLREIVERKVNYG